MKYAGKVYRNGQWVDDPTAINTPTQITISSRKERYKIVGVYIIHNDEHKIGYIGQSVNIYSRWSQHRHTLKRNKSEINEFQSEWNRLDGDFKFSIIERCDKDHLRERERYWADEYARNGYTLFNAYFIVKPTSLLIDEKYKSIFNKIMRLDTKGRLNLSQMEAYLDTL